MGMTSNSVFIFKEFDCGIRGGLRFIELINAKFTTCKTAAMLCEFIIEISLRNRKGRSLFSFCLLDPCYLFFQCRK